jgi:hypothetical protein
MLLHIFQDTWYRGSPPSRRAELPETDPKPGDCKRTEGDLVILKHKNDALDVQGSALAVSNSSDIVEIGSAITTENEYRVSVLSCGSTDLVTQGSKSRKPRDAVRRVYG